ncbi:MAG TPA: helix-turn-helix domain-containing protein [Polyangiaceae bacterium]|nr:helix-turn-helix domain-containing protein [Polyangiaceae bacterium]
MSAAKYLTLRDAATRLCTSSETIRFWIYQGRLKGYKPGRSVLVRETDLDALIESSAIDAQRAERAKRARRAARP